MMKLSTFKSLYVCPLLAILFYPFVATAISKPPHNTNYSFPAVIAFGDSILDTGNNNYLETIVKANFKPYGRDFIEGKATGRFCNGRVPSDIFVETLGIKEALPAYLDPNLSIEELLTGVCFASAGSGYDPLTIERSSVLSAEDQLNIFKEYIGKLKEAVGGNRTAFILAKSITIISMGSNDIAGTYYGSSYRRKEYDIEEYTSMLISEGSKFMQELYRLGVRRIGVFSLGPVGCVPMQRTVRGGEHRDCAESINQGCMIYNSKLYSSLMALSKELPDARLVYLENYKALNDLIQNHDHYGFEVGDSSCCGIANVELGPLCSSFTLKVCKDASKYVFWDSYHPTERAYIKVATETIRKDIDKFV